MSGRTTSDVSAPSPEAAVANDATAEQSAHRAIRLSLVISGVRCLATYLLIPFLVPLVSFLGDIAAPLGIALSLVAMVSGFYGVRRFWKSNHRGKWLYTVVMAFVFVILAAFLVSDINRLVSHGQLG